MTTPITTPKALQQAGFTKPELTVIPRIVLSLSGLEKQGKTHFSLTAPGPITYISVDMGHEGVLLKFKEKIHAFLEIDTPADPDAAKSGYDTYVTAYKAALRCPVTKTIIVDTKTEIWEMLRFARFGKLTQIMPFQYAGPNAEFTSLIRLAFNSNKNVIFLHKRKPVYIKDKRTGDYERSGFSNMGYLAQANVVVYRYGNDDDEYPGEFALQIEDCRQNPNLIGEELIGPMCTFSQLAQMILPETDDEDWE